MITFILDKIIGISGGYNYLSIDTLLNDNAVCPFIVNFNVGIFYAPLNTPCDYKM